MGEGAEGQSAPEFSVAGADYCPAQIGPFRILGLLGEGGMGRVYRAEQEQPHRQVALKVLRAAVAGSSEAARFRREVELLAELEHPGIARMYAAGEAQTDTGTVPYLAMECVDGVDVVSYASNAALGDAQRLALVANLCRTVHYAHSRGVIHRDLKPSNILVGSDGQPKVLDFGVARAVGREGATAMTATGQVIGTLSYMSWEQLRGDAAATDPRSDVYTLGVIAYQLLAGQLPYGSLAEPTLLTALEQRRAQEPMALSRCRADLRGDVETIVMKALAREPEQRYASAADMAADIERYLSHQPIQGRPPTAGYLLRLFVRRHRALAAGIASGALLLVLGAAVALFFAVRESRALRLAELRLAEREAVNSFMERMLTAADPAHALGRALTVRDVLDAARRSLDAQAGMPESVSLELNRIMGTTYLALNEVDTALELIATARVQAERIEGAAAPLALRLQIREAQALTAAGRHADAEALLQAVLPALVPATGEAEELRIDGQLAYGELLLTTSRVPEYRALTEATSAECEQRLRHDHPLCLSAAHHVAQGHYLSGNFPEGQRISVALTQRLRSTYGADHPQTLASRFQEATWLSENNEFAEAEAIYRELLAARIGVFGEAHPMTYESQAALAMTLYQQEKVQEAEPFARQAYEGARARLGLDHRMTADAQDVFALVVEALGKYDEAEQFYLLRLGEAEARAGGPTQRDLPTYNNYAFMLMDAGRLDDAKAAFIKLLDMDRKLLPADHPDHPRHAITYAECLLRRGEWAEARTILEPAVEIAERLHGWPHARTQKGAQRLLRSYRELGMKDQAAALEARIQAAQPPPS